MTDDDRDIDANRRKLLAATGAAATAGLAGCTISTPLGDFGFGGDDGADGGDDVGSPAHTTTYRTPTDQPDPTFTMAPCVANGSCFATPETVDLDSSLFDNGTLLTPPILTIDPGNLDFGDDDGGSGSLGDPSSVANNGAVKVEVTPNSKQTKNEKVGNEQTSETSDVVCTTQRRRMTAGGPANFLLDPQVGTIWPGAILEANSIANGQFSPALSQQRLGNASSSQVRNPIQVSVSLMNISGDNDVTVQNPSLANLRTARDDILNSYDSDAATPAKQKAKIHQVHSEEQLKVALGVHYDGNKVTVDNQFDFQQDTETNKLLAKYWQIYYTMDVSLPNPVANGLVSDRNQYLKANDVIIKNVSYGRMLLFSAESEYERQKISNSLKVALNAGGKSGKVDLDVNHKQVLRDTEINVQVLGGSASSGAKTISKPGEGAFSAIQNWIQRGATYDPKESPGVPISYHAKYVSNLDTANVYLTTTYQSRNCRPKTSKYRIHNMYWKVTQESDPGGDEDLYGDIYVVGWPIPKNGKLVPKSERIEPQGAPGSGKVWERSRSGYMGIEGGKRKQLNVDETIVFDDVDDLDESKSYIQVTAIPAEADDFSNEEFTNKKHVKHFLNEATSDPDRVGNGTPKYAIRWNDHGSEIELQFDITPIPP